VRAVSTAVAVPADAAVTVGRAAQCGWQDCHGATQITHITQITQITQQTTVPHHASMFPRACRTPTQSLLALRLSPTDVLPAAAAAACAMCCDCPVQRATPAPALS
jgi:hypothetical protein